MTKLKTLKDITEDECDGEIRSIMLKQEAIKHIKFLYNLKNNPKHHWNIKYYEGQIDFIKYFFNLTNEEIKND